MSEQLGILLEDKSVMDPQKGPAVQSFGGINPLHYNPYTESEWLSRLQQFERAIRPYAQRVLPPLKRHVRMQDMTTHQVCVVLMH